MTNLVRAWQIRFHGTRRCAIGSLLLLALVAGCDRLDMYDQPRYEPLEPSSFFHDGLSARPRVAGTIPRGGLHEDEAFSTGKESSRFVSKIPDAVNRALYDRNPSRFGQTFEATSAAEFRLKLLERGRERFDIHCSVCHDRTGNGNGIVVRRGFRKPPSYHSDRLRQVPAGYIFDVITRGFGAMASYKGRIDIADRWAVVAYIRALQLSQNSRLDEIPVEQQRELENQNPTASNTATSHEEDQR